MVAGCFEDEISPGVRAKVDELPRFHPVPIYESVEGFVKASVGSTEANYQRAKPVEIPPNNARCAPPLPTTQCADPHQHAEMKVADDQKQDEKPPTDPCYDPSAKVSAASAFVLPSTSNALYWVPPPSISRVQQQTMVLQCLWNHYHHHNITINMLCQQLLQYQHYRSQDLKLITQQQHLISQYEAMLQPLERPAHKHGIRAEENKAPDSSEDDDDEKAGSISGDKVHRAVPDPLHPIKWTKCVYMSPELTEDLLPRVDQAFPDTNLLSQYLRQSIYMQLISRRKLPDGGRIGVYHITAAGDRRIWLFNIDLTSNGERLFGVCCDNDAGRFPTWRVDAAITARHIASTYGIAEEALLLPVSSRGADYMDSLDSTVMDRTDGELLRDLLENTKFPSLTRKLSKKLKCTACDCKGLVQRRKHSLAPCKKCGHTAEQHGLPVLEMRVADFKRFIERSWTKPCDVEEKHDDDKKEDDSTCSNWPCCGDSCAVVANVENNGVHETHFERLMLIEVEGRQRHRDGSVQDRPVRGITGILLRKNLSRLGWEITCLHYCAVRAYAQHKLIGFGHRVKQLNLCSLHRMVAVRFTE